MACLVQGATLHNNFSVPALVVPVGNIHPEVMRSYLSALDQYTILPLDNFTPPGDYSRDHSAFKRLSWSVLSLFVTNNTLFIIINPRIGRRAA